MGGIPGFTDDVIINRRGKQGGERRFGVWSLGLGVVLTEQQPQTPNPKLQTPSHSTFLQVYLLHESGWFYVHKECGTV